MNNNQAKYNGLKVGIVGCGNIANTQIPYITKYVGKSQIALCDYNSARMNYLSNQFEITNLFPDVTALLREFEPQVVHILTPPQTHKVIALQCLRNGCHVFIEKPLSISFDEAQEIISEARKHKLLVCVDYLRVQDPFMAKTKDLLNSGEFGRVLNIAITEVDNYLERRNSGLIPQWMQDLPGEVIFDLFPHHLSILQGFFPDLQLQGTSQQMDVSGNLTALNTLFSSSQGTGSIHLSVAAYPVRNEVMFECSNGLIKLDFRNFLITTRKNSGQPALVERVLGNLVTSKQLMVGTIGNIFRVLRGKIDSYAGISNLIDNFYDAIREKQLSPISEEANLTITRLMDEIFEKTPKVKKIVEKKIVREPQLPTPKTLVTGGTGFIGEKLVRRLVGKGHGVRVLTHRDLTPKELASYEDRVEFMKGDIANSEDVERACAGIEQVYHLAAAMKGDWVHHIDATVGGTQNILTAIKKFHIKQLVYVSTIGLFNANKYPKGGLIDEDFPYEEKPSKRGYYSAAKLEAEKIVRGVLGDLEGTRVVIIRPGLVYGPGQDPLAGLTIRLSKRLALSFSHGKMLIPWVYVENLVDALILAGESPENGIFNVIDQESITMKESVQVYKKLTGKKIYTFYLPRPMLYLVWVGEKLLNFLKSNSIYYKLNGQNRSVRYSTSRIEKALGWSSKVSFRDGLQKTMAQ